MTTCQYDGCYGVAVYAFTFHGRDTHMHLCISHAGVLSAHGTSRIIPKGCCPLVGTSL